MHINIFGINISIISNKQIYEKIHGFLESNKSHYITTPNPEIMLKARYDEELFYILNKSNLAIPDGIGLKFASWFMGKNIKRITGADLAVNIFKIAQDNNLYVRIFNWKNSLSSKEDIESAIKKKYPKLIFKIIELDKSLLQNKFRNKNIDLDSNLGPKFKINLVALGAPWQEKFIYHNLTNTSSLSIGIGGALDFLTGKLKRAPKLLRIIGFEWFWRLMQQPKRIKRICNAVFIFSGYFLKWRFIYPFLYRPNVACLLYKKDGNNYKILLAERRDEANHWQLPQGGTDGETLWQAGKRELSEEISCDNFKSVAVFKNIWKYKFEEKNINSTNEEQNRQNKHGGYKGQKQGLFIAKFLGQDNDITINFWDHQDWKWVDADNLVNEVHEFRKKSAKIFLEKFRIITND